MSENGALVVPSRVKLVQIVAKEGLSAILVHKGVSLPKPIVLLTGLLEELWDGERRDEQKGFEETSHGTPDTLV